MFVAQITIFSWLNHYVRCSNHHFSWLNPQLHPPLKEWRYASRAWTTSIRPWRRAKPASCDMADGPAAGRLGMSTGNPWFSGENLWKTYGKRMENLWKTYGKPWKTYAFLYCLHSSLLMNLMVFVDFGLSYPPVNDQTLFILRSFSMAYLSRVHAFFQGPKNICLPS